MAGRSSRQPLRSSGSIKGISKRLPGKGSKTQSKKRAAYRSQNAFSLADDASDDDSGRLSHDLESGVKSEDDEEIDSDEAFESGDEQRFGSFKFSGSTKRSKKPTLSGHPNTTLKSTRHEIDLNEDSSEENTMVPRISTSSTRGTSKNESNSDLDEHSASDFEDDQGNDLMDLSEMLGSSSRNLNNAVLDGDDGLRNSSKSDGVDEIPYSKFEDRTLEDESSISDSLSDNTSEIRSSDDSDSETDSDASSLSEAIPEHDLVNFVSELDKNRKRQSETVTAAPTKFKKVRTGEHEMIEQTEESEYNLGSSSTGKKLRLEDMLDSLNSQSIKSLRKGRTLDAPLAKPIQDKLDRAAAYDTVKDQITKWQPAVKQLREASVLKFPLNEAARVQPNNNSLAASFKPTTELENEIDGILKSSGMQSERQIAAFEDLEMAKLSVEEVQKRRAELAIMRDLMFRQERKAKRQNKIKSKAYRKVHRKEREKLEAAMQEALGENEDSSRKNEERRARERMELRHKNTGKWAQKMITRADHGEGSRAAITEQLHRGEDLERKIRGLKDDDDDVSDSDESMYHSIEETDNPLPEKGVFSMKFMRDADSRESQANKDRDDYENGPERDPTRIEDNVGRRIFSPADLPNQKAQSLSAERVAKSSAQKSTKSMNKMPLEAASTVSKRTLSDDEANPWLSSVGRSKASKESVVSKDTDHSLKFAAKLTKAKRSGQIQHQGNINGPRLNLNQTLALKNAAQEIDSDGEIERETSMTYAAGRPALQQADLVAKAFAGDNVVAEFEADKTATQLEDAPQDIDVTLPGWGAWTGNGIKKRKNSKKITKHIEGVQAEKRRDAKLQHVIINEKRMKQAKPYMSQSVPFPFETKEQYERSLNLPIGPEWTTRTSFQKQITPHVIKKQGQVIAPMQKPFRD